MEWKYWKQIFNYIYHFIRHYYGDLRDSDKAFQFASFFIRDKNKDQFKNLADGSLRYNWFILCLSDGFADRFIESREYVTTSNETGTLHQRRVRFSIDLSNEHE